MNNCLHMYYHNYLLDLFNFPTFWCGVYLEAALIREGGMGGGTYSSKYGIPETAEQL